jgi:hypothetical protein
MGIMRIGGLLTVFVLGVGMLTLWRKERSRRKLGEATS